MMYVIGEGREGTEGKSPEALQQARKQMEEAPSGWKRCSRRPQKAANTRMRDKVKRQHELAEKAWQISQKMEALGEGKRGEAHASVGAIGAGRGPVAADVRAARHARRPRHSPVLGRWPGRCARWPTWAGYRLGVSILMLRANP